MGVPEWHAANQDDKLQQPSDAEQPAATDAAGNACFSSTTTTAAHDATANADESQAPTAAATATVNSSNSNQQQQQQQQQQGGPRMSQLNRLSAATGWCSGGDAAATQQRAQAGGDMRQPVVMGRGMPVGGFGMRTGPKHADPAEQCPGSFSYPIQSSTDG